MSQSVIVMHKRTIRMRAETEQNEKINETCTSLLVLPKTQQFDTLIARENGVEAFTDEAQQAIEREQQVGMNAKQIAQTILKDAAGLIVGASNGKLEFKMCLSRHQSRIKSSRCAQTTRTVLKDQPVVDLPTNQVAHQTQEMFILISDFLLLRVFLDVECLEFLCRLLDGLESRMRWTEWTE